ncbi:MAG: SpoIIE family protein phosphatase [Magnetococcales bacterium]|nr:SpoIIE family protein phosphatase [Magnetococcales bacterium]
MRATRNIQKNKPIILVVDDTPENIDVLKGALIDHYQVRPAPNGAIALRAARVQPLPDLVLLDIMMPGMDGYEVCRRLKEDPITSAIPVIFVTAKSEVEDELQGLSLGAVDYIIKPFSIPIVLARVATHLALRKAHRELDDRNRLLSEERGLIEKIIDKMRRADRIDERFLHCLVTPVETTAGDQLLAAFAPDGRQLVLLGDFTGHGLSAAIAGPLVGHLFNAGVKRGESGGRLFLEINQQLNARMPTGIFFGACMAEISADRRQARLLNAGMPDVLRLRRGEVLDRFSSSMLMLGIIPWSEDPEPVVIDLEPDDRLYLYSDGIIEAINADEVQFGGERLEQTLIHIVAEDAPLELLIDRLNAHAGKSTHDDDITLAEIRAS